MTVVSALSPVSLQTFFYQSGEIVRPSRLFFYRPQTEDPLVVYADALLSVPYDHPLLSGGSGRVPPVYVGTEPYRIRVFDSYGALIEDIDWLPGATIAGEGEPPPPIEGTTDLLTGDMLIGFRSGGSRSGFVRCNGNYIGNVGAGAGVTVERAHADTHALFIHLWGQDTGSALTITAGGRGSSAENDWLAAKAISLPDLRGRALAGLDTMGGATSALFTGLTFTKGNATSPGSTIGAAKTTQTLAQMPAHSHTVTDPGHNHLYEIPQISAGAGAGGGYSFGFGTAQTEPLEPTGITIASAGTGAAMTTVSPIGLVTVYIKL